jgi:hypothetical protein
MTENPFELLRLAPSASEEEIVRAAARLCQRAPDEATRNALRQAVRQLTGSAEERALYALLTPPQPEHDNAELERFAAAFRRAPAPVAPGRPCPDLDVDEVRLLLRQILAAELEAPASTLEAIETSDTPEEIARQTAEALWQSLLSDFRG